MTFVPMYITIEHLYASRLGILLNDVGWRCKPNIVGSSIVLGHQPTSCIKLIPLNERSFIL